MDTKTLCLGVLTLGDASGYDIRKHLEETFAHFMDISSNAVYPALKKLEKEKLVTFETVRQDNYPDKKVYSLTDEGHSFFFDALQELPPRHKVRSQLMLLMFFAEMLPVSRIREIMAERLEELDHWTKVCMEWQKSTEGTEAGIGQRFLVEHVMVTMDAESDFIKKNTNRFAQQLDKKAGEMK